MSLDGHVLAGRYRMGAQLGRGGMSTVYRAVDESLGRAVAIKILSPLASDPSAVERVRSEIRVLASLSHRNLVTLFDASSAPVDGVEKTFLVMELVDGPSLAERLLGGPLADEEANRLLRQMAEALEAVHARGIIHRDIKPGNILLTPVGAGGREFDAKLADFGIATLADRTSDLTATGTVIGTAAYLSPEQPRGEPATAASDVYSLGIVLLEALTGDHPFPGTLAETVAARLSRSPGIPATLPFGWRSLLGSMTAMSPGDRPTAADVLERLDGDGAPARTALMTEVASTDVLPPDAVTDPKTLLMPQGAVATELLPRSPDPGSGTAPQRRRRRNVVVGVAIAAAVGAAVAVAAVAGPFGNPTPADPMPSTSATPAASSPPSPSSSATSAPTVNPPGATVSPVTPTPLPPAPAATTNGNGNGNGKSHGNSGGNGKGKTK